MLRTLLSSRTFQAGATAAAVMALVVLLPVTAHALTIALEPGGTELGFAGSWAADPVDFEVWPPNTAPRTTIALPFVPGGSATIGFSPYFSDNVFFRFSLYGFEWNTIETVASSPSKAVTLFASPSEPLIGGYVAHYGMSTTYGESGTRLSGTFFVENQGYIAAAPDAGSTLAMLGLAVGALAGFRRNRRHWTT
jgi:hypothetical protein